MLSLYLVGLIWNSPNNQECVGECVKKNVLLALLKIKNKREYLSPIHNTYDILFITDYCLQTEKFKTVAKAQSFSNAMQINLNIVVTWIENNIKLYLIL